MTVVSILNGTLDMTLTFFLKRHSFRVKMIHNKPKSLYIVKIDGQFQHYRVSVILTLY